MSWGIDSHVMSSHSTYKSISCKKYASSERSNTAQSLSETHWDAFPHLPNVTVEVTTKCYDFWQYLQDQYISYAELHTHANKWTHVHVHRIGQTCTYLNSFNVGCPTKVKTSCTRPTPIGSHYHTSTALKLCVIKSKNLATAQSGTFSEIISQN